MNKNKTFYKLLLYFLSVISLSSGCTSSHTCNEKPVVKKIYYPNGKLLSETTYRCGRLDGESKSFSDDGGIHIWQYYDGKLGYAEDKDKEGFTIGESTYNFSGRLIKSTLSYPMSFIAMRECDYTGDYITADRIDIMRLRLCKTYYKYGDIRYIDTYSNGTVANRKAYDEDGKLKFEQNYNTW